MKTKQEALNDSITGKSIGRILGAPQLKATWTQSRIVRMFG